MGNKLNLTTIGGRIRNLRKENAVTQRLFAKSVGISQGHLSGIESNKTNPSQSFLIAVEYRYSVNMDWLSAGIVPKYLEKKRKESTEINNFSSAFYEKDSDLIEIMEIIREFPETKKAVLKLLRGKKETLDALAMLQYPSEEDINIYKIP